MFEAKPATAALACVLLVCLSAALALNTQTPCSKCEGYSLHEVDEIEAISLGGFHREFVDQHATSIGLTFTEKISAHWATDWTHQAIDASGLDHKPAYGEHTGPGRSSRAVAMASIAIYDAAIAVKGGYTSYCPTIIPGSRPNADVRVAISTAAQSILSRLFTKQTARFDSYLVSALQFIPSGSKYDEGKLVGQQAADCIWNLRLNDNSSIPEPTLGTGPGQYNPPAGQMLWQQDPISKKLLAMGAFWSSVTPFAIPSASHFRPPHPPDYNSHLWEVEYNYTRDVGEINSAMRSEEQTIIGYYWAYDGLPSLCAPPRLYNQIAMQLSQEQCMGLIETARMLAYINVAMADAGISAWEAKYYYNMARPITSIRQTDNAVWGDGNPNTKANASWVPLGAPASNTMGPDFTPPFPSYPSGHAVFGGTLFQTLRAYFGENYHFSFISDEFNGETRDSDGTTRPLVSRTFQNFSQPELENGMSRLYLGIHWRCDCDFGIKQGNSIADYVLQKLFKKL